MRYGEMQMKYQAGKDKNLEVTKGLPQGVNSTSIISQG